MFTMLTSHGTALTLSSQLRRFEEQLQSWFEERESQGQADHVQSDDGALNLLEDTREGILNYQVRSWPVTCHISRR